MCRSKAEGGQRCYGHAAEKLANAQSRFDGAQQAYESASMESSRARDPEKKAAALEKCRTLAARRDEAYEAMQSSLVDFASTNRGRSELVAKANAGTLPRSAALGIQRVVNRGQRLQQENYLVSRGKDRDDVEQMDDYGVTRQVAREKALARAEKADARARKAGTYVPPVEPEGPTGPYDDVRLPPLGDEEYDEYDEDDRYDGPDPDDYDADYEADRAAARYEDWIMRDPDY